MRVKLFYLQTLLFLLFLSEIFSQEIIFCKAVNENGDPIGIISNRKVETNNKIFILIKNNNKLEQQGMNLLIEKINNNIKQSIFSSTIKFSNLKNWAAYDYSFNQEGTYSVSLINDKGENLSTAFILVEDFKNNFIGINDYEVFPNSRIIFCEKVISNKPFNIKDKISLRFQNGEVFIYFINNRPLNTNIIQVRIWKKKNVNGPYEDFVDFKKFKIEPEWYDTYFKYQFQTEGYYRLDIFNDKDLLLKRAYIIVEK